MSFFFFHPEGGGYMFFFITASHQSRALWSLSQHILKGHKATDSIVSEDRLKLNSYTSNIFIYSDRREEAGRHIWESEGSNDHRETNTSADADADPCSVFGFLRCVTLTPCGWWRDETPRKLWWAATSAVASPLTQHRVTGCDRTDVDLMVNKQHMQQTAEESGDTRRLDSEAFGLIFLIRSVST